uniref:Uncharacterized protein n=1 Tax=Bionectria ochroleuca TaxID=29856 RepID=A0A8H7NFG0_BIOOC
MASRDRGRTPPCSGPAPPAADNEGRRALPEPESEWPSVRTSRSLTNSKSQHSLSNASGSSQPPRYLPLQPKGQGPLRALPPTLLQPAALHLPIIPPTSPAAAAAAEALYPGLPLPPALLLPAAAALPSPQPPPAQHPDPLRPLRAPERRPGPGSRQPTPFPGRLVPPRQAPRNQPRRPDEPGDDRPPILGSAEVAPQRAQSSSTPAAACAEGVVNPLFVVLASEGDPNSARTRFATKFSKDPLHGIVTLAMVSFFVSHYL